jgi:hypothetical protein
LTIFLSLCFPSEVARPTLLHQKTVQRTTGSPADSTTCVQGTDADDGKFHMI